MYGGKAHGVGFLDTLEADGGAGFGGDDGDELALGVGVADADGFAAGGVVQGDAAERDGEGAVAGDDVDGLAPAHERTADDVAPDKNAAGGDGAGEIKLREGSGSGRRGGVEHEGVALAKGVDAPAFERGGRERGADHGGLAKLPAVAEELGAQQEGVLGHATRGLAGADKDEDLGGEHGGAVDELEIRVPGGGGGGGTLPGEAELALGLVAVDEQGGQRGEPGMFGGGGGRGDGRSGRHGGAGRSQEEAGGGENGEAAGHGGRYQRFSWLMF